jgi:hypothetical protein
MTKSKSTPMTRERASELQRIAAQRNGGNIPPGTFAGRADATVQKREAGEANRKAKSS